jgi:hypothetical protein
VVERPSHVRGQVEAAVLHTGGIPENSTFALLVGHSLYQYSMPFLRRHFCGRGQQATRP